MTTPDYTVLPIPLLILCAALWCFLCGVPSFAFSEVPPGDMTCAEVAGEDGDPLTDDTPYPNDRFIYIRCKFPPHISKHVRADTAYPQYAVVMVPRYPTKKLGWTIKADGYNARPTNCNTWPDADYNAIVMRHCPDLYPDAALYPTNGTGSWGGPVNGENPLGWRMAAVMKYVNDNYGHLLDKGAGATLLGCSYGGSTSILQSMLIPDPWARALVNKVSACVPPTLLVKQTPPVGQYWTVRGIAETWGAFDWTRADFRTHADPYKYYRIVGSPVDTAVVFDLAILDVCEQQQLACFALWHNAGHNLTEPGVYLPFQALYSGPDSQARLDKPIVSFTSSTANYRGSARGHYNLGMEHKTAGISDAANRLAVPIRYLRRTGMGGGIPDQSHATTFNITIRRIPNFNLRSGETLVYRLADVQGTATAGTGEITINGLTLASSEAYTDLVLIR